jgi:hypothetical protein
MTLHNYRIQYQCVDNAGKILKEGTIIAKRKASEFEALTGLEKHLKTKVEGMTKIVCVKIRIDLGVLEDILNNPFGFSPWSK